MSDKSLKFAVLILVLVICFVKGSGMEQLTCIDRRGQKVQEGQKYNPKDDDLCYTCTCENGFSVRCTAVQCSPPKCTLLQKVEGECCNFHCIELPDHGPISDNGTNPHFPNNPTRYDEDPASLGLRLVASTVTSLLVLALLLFMIHRLRQRRMLVMRRLNAERREDEGVGYMSQFDQMDINIDFPPYEDPPPPYTPPKPPDFPVEEAPPPYEETPQVENMTPVGNSSIGFVGPCSGVTRASTDNSTNQPHSESTRQDSVADNNPDITRESENVATCARSNRSSLRPTCYSVGTDPRGSETVTCNASTPVISFHSDIPIQVSNQTTRATSDSIDSRVLNQTVNTPTLLDNRTVISESSLPRYLKKSDSMEIKWASSSPRNSFYQDSFNSFCNSQNRSLLSNPITSSATPDDSRPSSYVSPLESSQTDTRISNMIRENSAWKMEYSPGSCAFRISRNMDNSPPCPIVHRCGGNDVELDSVGSKVKEAPGVLSVKKASVANATSDEGCVTSPDESFSASFVVGLQSADSYKHLGSDSNHIAKDSCLNMNSNTKTHPNSDCNSSSFVDSTPVCSVVDDLSPKSPIRSSPTQDCGPENNGFSLQHSSGSDSPSILWRSNSDSSQSSVCSETGEKNASKGSISLRNDVKYPLPAATSMNSTHLPVHSSSNFSGSSGASNSTVTPVRECNLLDNSYTNHELRIKSDTTQEVTSEPDLRKPSAGHKPNAHRKVIYRDPEEMTLHKDTDCTDIRPVVQAAMDCVIDLDDNPVGTSTPKTKSNCIPPPAVAVLGRETADSAPARRSPMSHEKTTLRKLKQKRSRPHSNPVNIRNLESTVATESDSSTQRRRQSPELVHRLVNAWNSNAIYKEYGFIDSPDEGQHPTDPNCNVGSDSALCESRNTTTNQSVSPSLKADGKRNMSAERHKRDRESSGERSPQVGSNCPKKNEDSQWRNRLTDGAAAEGRGGDKAASRKDHRSRSPTRKSKRRSTTGRSWHEYSNRI